MSDRAASTTMLASAMARNNDFRPLHFTQNGVQPNAAAHEPLVENVVDDPFARGLAEGQRLAETAYHAERHQLLALIANCEALQDEPSEELAQLIAETVEHLVRQIVAAAPIDAEWLKQQADVAANLVAEADKARTLWVHPQDAALLMDSTLKLPVEADAAMMRGTVRIETSTGWIEHGRAVYLNELRSALGNEGANA